jgi:hypothetical protein
MVRGAEGVSLVDNVGWVATGKEDNQDVRTPEACARVSIDWAERRELQFEIPKSETARFIHRPGHKKHLCLKLTAKIRVVTGYARFIREQTKWLGIWIGAHQMFKEYHNRCMTKARATDARLPSLRGTHGVVPACERSV